MFVWIWAGASDQAVRLNIFTVTKAAPLPNLFCPSPAHITVPICPTLPIGALFYPSLLHSILSKPLLPFLQICLPWWAAESADNTSKNALAFPIVPPAVHWIVRCWSIFYNWCWLFKGSEHQQKRHNCIFRIGQSISHLQNENNGIDVLKKVVVRIIKLMDVVCVVHRCHHHYYQKDQGQHIFVLS